jgi:hypothetical protein
MTMTVGKAALAIIEQRFGGRVSYDSGHTQTGSTLIVTFPKEVGEYQVGLRTNKNKLTLYLNAKTRDGHATEHVLPSTARIEKRYPVGGTESPANSLLDVRRAPVLSPRKNDLLRVALELDELEALLRRYLNRSDDLANLRKELVVACREVEKETKGLKTGERLALVKRRINQGAFRDLLFKVQGEACCITGIPDRQLLVASHIKPWAACEDEPASRGDEANGLLLSVHWDALFDSGLISFDSAWRLMISCRLSKAAQEHLGVRNAAALGSALRSPQRARFLEYHRTSVFKAS